MDLLNIGGLIAGLSSLAGLAKVVIDYGRMVQKVDGMQASITFLTANVSLLSEKLTEFQLHTARTYVTDRALSESVQGVYNRLDKLNDRLDSLIVLATRHEKREG